MSARRHLRPVEAEPAPAEALIVFEINTQTGELGKRVGELTEFTQPLTDALGKAEGRIRYLDGRITQMERDDEEEARKHKLWAEAEGLHTWWALACNHPGSKFAAEEFYQVLPRLREREVGHLGVLKAIAGAAFDPGTKQMRNGKVERYDDWELINRSPSKHRSFVNRAPGQGEQWKLWLLQHIESQLEERDRDRKATAVFNSKR